MTTKQRTRKQQAGPAGEPPAQAPTEDDGPPTVDLPLPSRPGGAPARAHDAEGLFYDDARFAALAHIVRGARPCSPEQLGHIGVEASEERLPTSEEMVAAAAALELLRAEHLAILRSRRAGGSGVPVQDRER